MAKFADAVLSIIGFLTICIVAFSLLTRQARLIGSPPFITSTALSVVQKSDVSKSKGGSARKTKTGSLVAVAPPLSTPPPAVTSEKSRTVASSVQKRRVANSSTEPASTSSSTVSPGQSAPTVASHVGSQEPAPSAYPIRLQVNRAYYAYRFIPNGEYTPTWVPRKGKVFLVCNVTVGFAGDEGSLTVDSGSFRMIGSNRQAYGSLDPSSTYQGLDLVSATMIPGGVATGDIVFQVDYGVRPLNVECTVNPY